MYVEKNRGFFLIKTFHLRFLGLYGTSPVQKAASCVNSSHTYSKWNIIEKECESKRLVLEGVDEEIRG